MLLLCGPMPLSLDLVHGTVPCFPQAKLPGPTRALPLRGRALTLLIMRCMMVLGMRSRTVLLTMAMYESTRFRMVSTCRSSCGSMECMKLSEPFSSVSLACHQDQRASGWLVPGRQVPVILRGLRPSPPNVLGTLRPREEQLA